MANYQPELSFEDRLNIKEFNSLLEQFNVLAQDAAAMLDVTHITVSRWRHGARRLPYHRVQQLRALLEARVDIAAPKATEPTPAPKRIMVVKRGEGDAQAR